MDLVNAIAKARFSSVKPQRVQLHKNQSLQVDLLCFEARQELTVEDGHWGYYVITGSSTITSGETVNVVPQGQLVVIEGEQHVVANREERRLVCLVFGPGTE